MPFYGLDTLRHPYYQLDERIVWPSVDLLKLDWNEVDAIHSILCRQLPGFDSDFYGWPEESVSGSQRHLSFMRQNDVLKKAGLVFEVRVLINYAGGASNHEMREPITQGRSPSFETDRIYFKSYLFPVRTFDVASGRVTQLKPYSFREIEQAFTHGGEDAGRREKWTIALFDAVDYSEFQNSLLDKLKSLGEYGPSKLFYPIVIERVSYCLQLLHFDQAVVMASAFAELLNLIGADDWSKLDSLTRWQKYLEGWNLERFSSRTGNPHWRFISIPEVNLKS